MNKNKILKKYWFLSIQKSMYVKHLTYAEWIYKNDENGSEMCLINELPTAFQFKISLTTIWSNKLFEFESLVTY